MEPDIRADQGEQIAKAYRSFICASARDLQAQELPVSEPGSSCPDLLIGARLYDLSV